MNCNSLRPVIRLTTRPTPSLHAGCRSSRFVQECKLWRNISRFNSTFTKSKQSRSSINTTTGISVVAVLYAGFVTYAYIRATARHSTENAATPRVQHIQTGDGFHFPKPVALSSEQATQKLRDEEASYGAHDFPGIQQYDVVRVPSNSPSEDHYAHAVISDPTGSGSDWLAWGVFDGHIASSLSAELQKSFLPHIHAHLSASLKTSDRTSESIAKALESAFLAYDDTIIQDASAATKAQVPYASGIARIRLGSAGSCVLLALYDPSSRQLHIACTGDSRAVLGRKSADGSWQTIPLSVDQTGHNADEIARLALEHPDEPNVVKNGRVLGLAVSRALGDGQWKWDRGTQEVMMNAYSAKKWVDLDALKTPPYLTARPIVTTVEIRPHGGDVLIMASDGLWDRMTNEQAVELVKRWEGAKGKMETRRALAEPDEDLTRRASEVANSHWELKDRDMVVKDENVATHLVRNAFGGANEERLRGILLLEAPKSRDMRDDVTVQVILFNNSS